MSPSPAIPVVETRLVSKQFGGVQALTDASISFLAGEVHCLAGENGSGKSTLIKVISGAHKPSSGKLVINGQTHDSVSPQQAMQLGIEVIYQDFSLLPNLTVAENIALPQRTTARRLFAPRTAMRSAAVEAIDRAGVRLDPDATVRDLTVADRQLCAIVRAMAHNSVFLAMDEPTTALTWREVDTLFEAVNTLRTQGVAVAFISHKLQEVFTIADRVSIMRNGAIVSSGEPASFTHQSLTEGMTGRPNATFPRSAPTWLDKPPALRVENLSHPPLFADISLTVGQGEIVGLSGLLGSGRTEVAEAIAGLRPARAGTIRVRGDLHAVTSVGAAVRAGIGYVPEDRLTQGLFLDQPILDNLAAAGLGEFTGRFGLLRGRALRRACVAIAKALRIKLQAMTDPVRSLSGGNAQRVLIGKWLITEPRVLILNGPTVGVDVGSKFDILALLHAHSLKGLGILVISDDVPELVATCHRVLIMRNGRITDTVTGSRLSEEALLKAVSG
jgi:simple sugar transport system ATP-binding protein